MAVRRCLGSALRRRLTAPCKYYGNSGTPFFSRGGLSSSSSSSSSSSLLVNGARCRPPGVPDTDDDDARLSALAALVADENDKVNLVSRQGGARLSTPTSASSLEKTSFAAHVMERHVLDSLSLLPFIDALAAADTGTSSSGRGGGLRVIDIGCGGGFPSLPLAIVRPKHSFVLVDATRKKLRFVERAVEHLGIENVSVRCARAEALGRNRREREGSDVAVCRALAPLPVLAELCLPLVRAGGVLFALKGPRGERLARELNDGQFAVDACGGGQLRVEDLPDGAGGEGRTLIVIDKLQHTPWQFPREDGTPKKRPLMRL